MRMRRLRSEMIRDMVKETRLHKDDLILPLFFDESLKEIANTGSMPGVPTYPVSMCQTVALSVKEKGLRSVLLFGIPSMKDPLGKQAYDHDGVTQKVIRGMKDSGLFLIADLCLCEYTDHGHCGILKEGKVDNDLTLQYYSKIAISLAEAGADMVAPSGMMDQTWSHQAE
jgi:Delta-aminolevulinic acid dehydratase